MKKQKELMCLICKENPARTRGLCNTCYKQFHTELHSLPEDRRAEFEQEMIEDNLILPSSKETPRSTNVFRERAAKFKDPLQAFVDEALHSVAEEKHEYVEPSATKKKARKPKRHNDE